MSRKPGEVTILGMLLTVGGVRKGYRAGLYLSCWLFASEKLGHELTLEEYGDYWKKSRATYYRERGYLASSLPKAWRSKLLKMRSGSTRRGRRRIGKLCETKRRCSQNCWAWPGE